jgi:plasmid stabilization system protein ParE
MMAYHVQITGRAKADIHEAAEWYAKRDAAVGAVWTAGIDASIESLGEDPERCSLAHETDRFPFELRELLFGAGRRKTHRILFRIDEDRVEILAVRHTSRRDLSPGEIGESESDD